MNIIFLGAPGAGKGTQSEIVSQKLSIPAISTGNIIRAAIKGGTEMGLKAREYTDKGQLVPDEVVIGIIKNRLAESDCEGGFILDGFPRTVPQAEALETMGVRIDRVVDIDVPDENIVSRMAGRRVCPSCGAGYHVEHIKPKKEGVCDVCGAELIIRPDDKPETVLERLKVYHDQTEPLKSFYRDRGVLRSVDGTLGVAEVSELTLQALEA